MRHNATCRGIMLFMGVLVCSGVAQECRSYTHKDDVILGMPADVPEGWFVYKKQRADGLYKSDLRNFQEQVIPRTEDMSPVSIEISDDGQWILFINISDTMPRAGEDDTVRQGDFSNLYLIKYDGSVSVKVPIQIQTGHRFFTHGPPTIAGFYRQSPKGAEIFYYDYHWAGVTRIRAVSVDLTGARPVFGEDRIIAETGDTKRVVPYGGTLVTTVCADQIFGLFMEYIDPVYEDQQLVFADSADTMVIDTHIIVSKASIRNAFITIPDGGHGMAGPHHFYSWSQDRIAPPWATEEYDTYWGCGETMSHDGAFCLTNSGWIGSECVPNKHTNMDHKGFYITRFLRFDEPSMPIDEQIDNPANGRSINWCPPRYRVGDYLDVDFNSWSFSNHNQYVIGALNGQVLRDYDLAPGLWVIEWTTNTWTCVTPGNNARLDDPAMFLTNPPPQSVAPRATGAGSALHRGRSLAVALDGRVTLPKGVRQFRAYSVLGRLLAQQGTNPAGDGAHQSARTRKIAAGGVVIVKTGSR